MIAPLTILLFARTRRLALGLLALAALTVFAVPAQALPRVQEVTSPGGIKAWLIADSRLPILSLSFAFEGGMETDPPDRQGLARLAMSLMDEGTQSMDASAFHQALEDDAIEFSMEARRDSLNGHLRVLTETRERAARLVAEALTQPRFDDVDIARMRNAQLALLRRSLNDPDWLAQRAMLDIALAGHPYGQWVLGTRDSLERITSQDLRDFTRGRLARDNLTVTAVGDATPEVLGALLDQIFGGLPAQSRPVGMPPARLKDLGQSVLMPRQGAQTTLLLSAAAPSYRDPDWFAAMIVNFVLGGGSFESRLMTETREKRGLTYGASSFLTPYRELGMIQARASANNDRAAKALAVMRQVWSRMAKTGPTSKELRQAKDYLAGSHAVALTSSDDMSALMLSMKRTGMGPDFLSEYPKRLRAVTARQAQKAAAKMLTPSPLILMVGAPEHMAPTKTIPTLLESGTPITQQEE